MEPPSCNNRPVLRVLNHNQLSNIQVLHILNPKVSQKPNFIPKPVKRNVTTDESGNAIEFVPPIPKKICNQQVPSSIGKIILPATVTQFPTHRTSTHEVLSPVSIPKPSKTLITTDDNGNSIFVPPIPKTIWNQQEPSSVKVNLPATGIQLSTNLTAIPEVPSIYKATTLPRRKLSLSLKNRHTIPAPLHVQDKPTSAVREIYEHSSKQAIPPTLKELLETTLPANEHSSEQIVQPTDTLKELLKTTLPANYSHEILSVEPLKPYHQHKDYDQTKMFHAQVRVNLRSKDDALQWLEDYKKSSYTDWRVRNTYPENTQQIIFKKGYRCHHNTLAQYRDTKRGAHKKHTQCDAYISLTVKNFNMKRSSDTLLKAYPCEINLNHCHNHPVQAADALKHRRPGPAVVETFTELFKKGHSPSSALQTHQYDLQIANPEDFFEILADGAECPNLQWTYHLYRKLYLKEYGAPTGVAMLEALKAAVIKYNEECGSVCAVVEVFENCDVVLALCTPFMKRVHQHLKASGEMGFIDSGGSMDRHNTRVFTLLAPSVAGALPTGVVMTSSESEVVLSHSFSLLKSIMPCDAFHGRGPERGPELMMTDDSAAERNALASAFPGIILLLCLFHVLNAFWRYVWDNKHKVKAEDREEIFLLFKQWCRASTEEDFKNKFSEIMTHPKISTNQCLVKQLRGLCDRAPEWALCYRNELLTRGNDTNNYSEATVRLFKEYVLNRVKAYSEVQLFDFFATRLDAYFERRVAAVLNNRKESYWKSKHFIPPAKIVPLKCSKLPFDNMYKVKNSQKSTEYTVDMELEICSCPVGKTGAPCKHQFAVVKEFQLSSSQFLPFEDENAKFILHQIMSTTAARPGWYASLKGGPINSEPSISDTSDAEAPRGEINKNQDTPAPTEKIDMNPDEPDDSLLIEPQRAFDQERLDEASKALEAMYNFMQEGLTQRPDTFLPAVEKFTSSFNKTKALSENAILSSMHLFANQTIGSKSVRRGRYIKVNTAATVRRKYMSLAGRKLARQGRPPKSAYTSEHGYAVAKSKVAAWDRPGPKRSALPHNISFKLSQHAKKN